VGRDTGYTVEEIVDLCTARGRVYVCGFIYVSPEWEQDSVLLMVLLANKSLNTGHMKR